MIISSGTVLEPTRGALVTIYCFCQISELFCSLTVSRMEFGDYEISTSVYDRKWHNTSSGFKTSSMLNNSVL